MTEINGIDIPHGRKYVDFNQTTPASPDVSAIKSVKDLVNILSELQTRVEGLEKENKILREAVTERVTKKETVQLLSRVEALRLPKSGLFSDSFVVRAIAVYGHWFVCNLALSLVFTLLAIILMVVLGIPTALQDPLL